ncbi:MAG: hypothetical protein LBP67_03910 [Bacteroidales bacterium]|jgi:hypothetical protein|nr:hypothetical protein [Bacteroidales bacterium]
MQNEDFARNLYGRWDSFFANNVERIIDEVLLQGKGESGKVKDDEEKLSPLNSHLSPKESLLIERLELDLGSILEEEFDEQFPIRFKEKLKEALIQWKGESGKVKDDEGNLSPFNSHLSPKKDLSLFTFHLSILKHFLLRGTLPWNATDEHKDINRLFLKVLRESSKELKKFLQTYGHYTSLQERLVFQLKDPQLEKGVHLLEPGSGEFIISYLKFLQVKHKETEQAGITQGDFRNTVWFVVYSYLLTNRSSYFDKKSFVTQMLLQLAGKYNLNYNTLLQLMTSELEQFAKKLTIPHELFQILSQLQKEFTEKQYQESSINAAKFYKTIYHSLQKDIRKNIPQNSREALFSILSKAGSCRAFLQQLSENEIIALVPVVVPDKSDFVIATAKSLDSITDKKSHSTFNSQFSTQKLQGKAGGEFRLLKWQIIFPLLLENKGSSFNRKYFVQQIFSKVAARYNVDILLLLGFFNKESEIEKLDKELKNIISRLFDELQEKQSNKGTGQYFDLFELIRKAVNKNIKLTSEQIKLIRIQLSDNNLCRKIISQFGETELTKLFILFYPKVSKEVLTFLKNLDSIFRDKNLLNKSGSGFNKQKWNILLSQPESNYFNFNKIVYSILEEAEALYEISRFELLLAFLDEKTVYNLSYNTKKVIEELYRKEKQQWIKLIIESTTEEDKQQLIQKFASQESPFIKSYLQTMDDCFTGNKTFANNFSIIKWRIIFNVFIGSRKIQFNKRHFIRYSLQEIAAHYGLSLQEILKYCMENFKRNQAKETQEIIRIITELAQENTRKDVSFQQVEPEFTINLKEQLKVYGKKEEVLLEKLEQQTKYIEYIRNILGITLQLRDYITNELKLTFDNLKLLQIILGLSGSYAALSRVDILERILRNVSLQLPYKHKQLLWNKLIELSRNNKLLMQVIKRQNGFTDNSEMKNKNNQENQILIKEELKLKEMEKMMNDQTDSVFVNNAGMVLLSPFIQRLFTMLEFTEENKFKNKEAQIKAIYLLQYAVFGKTNFPEHELMLNKILMGLKISETVPLNTELSLYEQETIDSMLKSVLQHWDKLKNTGIEGFRESFLQREGKSEEKEDAYILTVGDKPYDMLLDSIPWNFRLIKFPWMEKRMEVKWR